jgi:hypothetical protein
MQLEAACLVGFLFNPEDGGSMFLQHVTKHLQDYSVTSQDSTLFILLLITTEMHALLLILL